MILPKLSKWTRVGFFTAAAFTMSAVCAFHASHVGVKTPHIHVKNFGENGGGMDGIQPRPSAPGIYFGAPVHVQGMDLSAPLENFEAEFNKQVDEQDKDRSNDYFYAALADGAGAIAALVSVIIEATAVEEDPSETEANKADKSNRDGHHERSPEDSGDRPYEEAETSERNNNTTHQIDS